MDLPLQRRGECLMADQFWHEYDQFDKTHTTPPVDLLVWVVEGDGVVNNGYFDGFTWRLWTGTDDCDVTHWAHLAFPSFPSDQKDQYVYRVTRKDNHKGYYHQPLKRTVNARSFTALLLSAGQYQRYTITKVERAKTGEFEDVTTDYVATKP